MGVPEIGIGLIIGFISGFIPGLHPNLISQFLNSLGLLSFEIAIILVFCNSILDYFQTLIFAPDEESALAYSPILKVLREGGAAPILKLLRMAILSSLLLFLLLLPLLSFYFSFLKKIKRFVVWSLPFYISFLIFKEKNKIETLLIFLISGILGWFSIKFLKNPLFSLLSGIYGISNLIIKEEVREIEYRKLFGLPIRKREIILSVLLGFFGAVFMHSFPALTPSQVSFLFLPLGIYEKLLAIMCLTISDSLLSLWLPFSYGKSRIGALEMVKEQIKQSNFFYLLNLSIISMALSFFIGKFILRFNLGKYKRWVIGLIIFIQVLIEIKGLSFLILSSLLGILTDKLKVKKGFCMGCLIIPTLIYYL